MWPGLPSRGLENDYVCLKRCFWETEMDQVEDLFHLASTPKLARAACSE